MNTDYEEGKKAAKAYYTSQGFASLSRKIKAEDAIKLFKTNERESMTQMSPPLPKHRRDWIKGFKEGQVQALAAD